MKTKHARHATALTVALVAALAPAGVAVAITKIGKTPRVEPVLATFSFASTHEKQRFCAGEDGTYIEIRAHHEGTQVGDPRISGDLELEAHNLVNLATGLGTSVGTFTIRDPDTNARKATGSYHGIFTEGSKFHGMSVASVRDGDERGEYIALFKADVDLATGTVTGEVGGASTDARTPAVIQRGACSGPWQKVGGAG